MFDKEYSFTGKHAEYVKDLKDVAQIFDTNIDLYILAPIIGFLYGHKSSLDKNGDIIAKIGSGQIMRNQLQLKFNYRLIMMLDDSEGLSEEKRIDRAFRDNDKAQLLEKNMETYESHVLGGIEYLHDKIYKEGLSRDEHIDRLADFIDDFNDDLESRVSDEDIIEIINKY